MAESLISRVKRIISGGANAFVTALEDAAPRVVMQEAIEEVDRTYDDLRAELGRLVAQKHLANKELLAKNARHEELGQQLETALAEGREDLAEVAVAKQLDIEAQIPVLESNLVDLGDSEKELENLMAALKAKKREMEDDLVSFEQSQKDAETTTLEAGGGHSASIETARSVENATASFERAFKNATGQQLDRDGLDASALQELESLARKNRIKERLEAAKSKMQNG
ncbi:MAG: PspA/IM30 family protein [Sneathiellales bacterium]|nr:PspA/IM30 family protein [Sneathiellales bacterium]